MPNLESKLNIRFIDLFHSRAQSSTTEKTKARFEWSPRAFVAELFPSKERPSVSFLFNKILRRSQFCVELQHTCRRLPIFLGCFICYPIFRVDIWHGIWINCSCGMCDLNSFAFYWAAAYWPNQIRSDNWFLLVDFWTIFESHLNDRFFLFLAFLLFSAKRVGRNRKSKRYLLFLLSHIFFFHKWIHSFKSMSLVRQFNFNDDNNNYRHNCCSALRFWCERKLEHSVWNVVQCT